MTEPSAVPAVTSSPLPLGQSFEQTAAERSALTELRHINVDPTNAVTTVYGAIPAIMALKPAIDATFKAFPMKFVDNLPLYASGALFAHTTWLFATTPSPEVQELIAQAVRGRGRVVSVAETAVVHGLIPAEVLKDLQGPKGHKNIAVDLIGVTGVLRRHWSALEGKVPLTLSDLASYEQLAQKLVQTLGERELAPAADSAAALDRKRAFTLLAEAYDEVRAAIVYVRRKHGDADQIAPSIYAGRGGSKRKEGDEEEVAPTPGASTTPSGAAAAVPVGHPDSNPLAS